MSLPEDMIMKQLDFLLRQSDPGDIMHHLHVVTSDGKPGPFGPPAAEQLETAVYAIAPDSTVDANEFTAKVITAAAVGNLEKKRLPVFAALSQEMWTVPQVDELAKQLLGSGRSLAEHPDMVEVTLVYGACRDGRRWTGRRYLTGPRAGEVEDVRLLVGRVQPREGQIAVAPLVRTLVGLTM